MDGFVSDVTSLQWNVRVAYYRTTSFLSNGMTKSVLSLTVNKRTIHFVFLTHRVLAIDLGKATSPVFVYVR